MKKLESSGQVLQNMVARLFLVHGISLRQCWILIWSAEKKQSAGLEDCPHWHENWKGSKCGGNPDWSVGKTNPGADKSDLSIRDLSNLPPPHHLTHSPLTVESSLRSDKENPITALKQNIIQTWKKRDLSTNHVSLEKITTKKPNLILNTFKIGLLRLNLALNC